MLSYAQNGEDVILWRALGHLETGFYVDVGAADPEEHSVTNAFYERGWSGINVEPLQEHFKRLSAVRTRDLNLKVAAASKAGLCTLHAIGGTGLSTSDSQIAERHVEAGWQATPVIVPALTLESILSSRAPDAIHFLKVDAEGAEASVLAGMNFGMHRPWIVLVESTAPLSPEDTSAAWEPVLLGSGYEFAYFDGLNRYYVASEHRDLSGRLAVQPNVFDKFVPIALDREVRRGNTLQAERDQLGAVLQSHEVERTALQAELAQARGAESLITEECAALRKGHDDMAAALEKAEASSEQLGIELERARGEAAAAYRREEAAEAAMAVMEMDLVRKDSEIAALGSRLHAVASGEQTLLDARERSARDAAEAEAWLQAVRSSTSWRLTRPFRVGGRLLLSVRGKN